MKVTRTFIKKTITAKGYDTVKNEPVEITFDVIFTGNLEADILRDKPNSLAISSYDTVYEGNVILGMTAEEFIKYHTIEKEKETE